MWLRDQLPKDMPQARSVIYGYNTQLVASVSIQTVDDIAISLVDALRSVGIGSPSTKSLIFLAHSLGGIVLKKALMLLANGDQIEQSMLGFVKGPYFLVFRTRECTRPICGQWCMDNQTSH